MSTSDAFAEWFQTMIGKKTTQTLEEFFRTDDEEEGESDENMHEMQG